MRLAQRARLCPACGGREPPDARWCGDCGASLAAHDPPVAIHLAEVDAEPQAPARSPQRRWVGIVLVVLLALGAGVLADPEVTGDPDLLGRLDERTGRSSLLPPVDDLQLLWRRPVDELGASAEPVRLIDLGTHAVVGDEVVDLTGAAGVVRLPAGAAPSPDGHVLLVDGGELVGVDARTGLVQSRVAVTGGGQWRPHGAVLGWVAGAAVFADAAGVLGAVEPDGRVRWVGADDWRWDGTGDGTDWLVVTQPEGSLDRVLVVDGATGEVHRDVGPAGAVHAPAVHGDVLVWVAPHGGVDRGLGHPVEVHGVRLDRTGRTWVATDLPPTSGVPEAIHLAAVEDGFVVAYWTTGQATTAVWLAPDGSRTGFASVVGTGRTAEQWPVTSLLDEALAHVDPVRGEVRVVGRHGRIRWATPTLPGEGVVAVGDLVLVRTPPRGEVLQSRLRLLDAESGRTRWVRVTADTQVQELIGVLGGHVGVGTGPRSTPVAEQAWLDLDTGRRRSGVGLAAAALGVALDDVPEVALLGRVAVGAQVRPVFVLPDGRTVGIDPGSAASPVVTLLAGRGGVVAGGDAALSGPAATATVADDRTAVRLGAASIAAFDPATGRQQWRTTTATALRTDRAVLLAEVVVALGVDGSVRAWDRDDGTLRWTASVSAVTALTAGGEEVVVGTARGEVVVLDRDGAVLQSVRAGRDAVEDVAVVDGRVVLTLGADVVGLGRGAVFVEPADRVDVP